MDTKYDIKRCYDINDINFINTIVFCHGNINENNIELFQDQKLLMQLLRLFQQNIHFITIDININTKPTIQGDIFDLSKLSTIHNKKIKNIIYMNASCSYNNIILSIIQLFKYNIVHPTEYNITCTNMINLLHRFYLQNALTNSMKNKLNKQYAKIYDIIVQSNKNINKYYDDNINIINIVNPCDTLNTLIYLYVKGRLLDENKNTVSQKIIKTIFKNFNIILIKHKSYDFLIQNKSVFMIRGPYHGFMFKQT